MRDLRSYGVQEIKKQDEILSCTMQKKWGRMLTSYGVNELEKLQGSGKRKGK